MNKEVIKKMAILTEDEFKEINREWNETGDGKGNFPEGEYWQIVLKAQLNKLLSLKWTCEKCKGEGGWKGTEGEPDTMCEDCNGTGEGKPMLGVIKRVQEVPKPHSETQLFPVTYEDGWYKAIEAYSDAGFVQIEKE